MMKKIVTAVLAVVLLAACGNDEKTITVKSDDGTETVLNTDPSKINDALAKSQEKAEELKGLTPYTTDELKQFVPENLGELQRSSFNAQSAMGISTITATYKLPEGEKQFELQVMDCAGEAGSGIYTLQYFSLMSFQSENDEEYTKAIDFNGGKAIESAKKDGSEAKFIFFAKDRLLVSLEGEQVSVAELKKIAEGLKF